MRGQKVIMRRLIFLDYDLFQPDQTVGDALDFLNSNRNFLIVPIGINNKVIGVCSIIDLIKFPREEALSRVASKGFFYIRDEANIQESWNAFLESKDDQAIVLNRYGEFRGILKRADLLEALLYEQRQKNYWFQKTIEFAHEGIIGCDRSGKMQVINTAAERILGISSESLGVAVESVAPESRIYEAMDTKQTILNVERYYPATDITALVNYQPIMESVDGDVVGGAITLREISEIKKLTRELFRVTELKNYMDAILNNINDGVVEIDNESTILYVNPAYERIFNIPSTRVLGRKLSQIEPQANLLKVLKTGEPVISAVSHVRTVDVNVVFDGFPIKSGNNIMGALAIFRPVEEISFLYKQIQTLALLNEELEQKLSEREPLPVCFNNIIGRSGRFRDALSLAAKVAKKDTTVLIRGESGTGKELLARAIHEASSRHNKPLIRVNCAAIPENLLETEMFGYDAGAFTGAASSGKIGKFESANGGTIFLDEIGDLSFSIQAKLLRVIQEKDFERVGGSKTIKTNIRIIAATNRDLEDLIKRRLFREDLYYRINVFTISLPPLRDRKEDILPLTNYYLQKHQSGRRISLSREAYRTILSYPWHGNARELENAIERALVVAEKEIIQEKDLPSYILSAVSLNNFSSMETDEGTLSDHLKKIEKEGIINALKEARNNRTKAIQKLGMSRKLFYRRLKDYGLTELKS
jgi:PAS domain S-box-containing protein